MTEKTYTEKLIESLRKESADASAASAVGGPMFKEGMTVLATKFQAAADEIERLDRLPDMLMRQSTQRLQYIHVLEKRIKDLEQCYTWMHTELLTLSPRLSGVYKKGVDDCLKAVAPFMKKEKIG